MELVLLRALLTVAETGNVTTAAHQLSVTQPALSKQLARLERQFGAPLLIRGRHGATLTELGREILPAVADLISRAEELTDHARRHADGQDGWLRVGFGMSSLRLAPCAVAEFRRRYPKVHVTLNDLPSALQLDRVRRGELDVGYVRADPPSPLAGHRVGRDRLAVATTGARPPMRSLGRWLDGRRLIRLTRERGPGLAAQTDALYRHYGVAPDVRQEADDLLTVLALVAAGVGESLVPASTAAIADDGVGVHPIPGAVAAWATGIVWNPALLTPVTRNFVTVATGLRSAPASAGRPARRSTQRRTL